MKPGSHHSPVVRAKISARVRTAMADPAVRQKISERTKEGMAVAAVRRRIKTGMARAYAPDGDLNILIALWEGATPDVRQALIARIMAPAIGGGAQ